MAVWVVKSVGNKKWRHAHIICCEIFVCLIKLRNFLLFEEEKNLNFVFIKHEILGKRKSLEICVCTDFQIKGDTYDLSFGSFW